MLIALIGPRAACSSFVFVVLLGACGGSTPAPPEQSVPKVESRVDLDKLNVPDHSAAAMAARDAPQIVTTKGTLQATLNGHVQTFEMLTVGANAAVWVPATRVARVMVGGSQGTGFPMLRVLLEGVRLDTLALPATFPLGGVGSKVVLPPEDPQQPRVAARPRIVYEIEARKIWETDPQGPEVGSITIESFEGKRITGTFEVKLKPRSVAFGPPIEITHGTFAIDLRLNGVAPGPGK